MPSLLLASTEDCRPPACWPCQGLCSVGSRTTPAALCSQLALCSVFCLSDFGLFFELNVGDNSKDMVQWPRGESPFKGGVPASDWVMCDVRDMKMSIPPHLSNLRGPAEHSVDGCHWCVLGESSWSEGVMVTWDRKHAGLELTRAECPRVSGDLGPLRWAAGALAVFIDRCVSQCWW